MNEELTLIALGDATVETRQRVNGFEPDDLYVIGKAQLN